MGGEGQSKNQDGSVIKATALCVFVQHPRVYNISRVFDWYRLWPLLYWLFTLLQFHCVKNTLAYIQMLIGLMHNTKHHMLSSNDFSFSNKPWLWFWTYHSVDLWKWQWLCLCNMYASSFTCCSCKPIMVTAIDKSCLGFKHD